MKIGDSRPYPPTGLTTALWKKIEPRLVKYDSLVSTQKGVFLGPLLHGSKSFSGDRYPHVVFYRGVYYLEDGHTRVARAILSGMSAGKVRVFTIPN